MQAVQLSIMLADSRKAMQQKDGAHLDGRSAVHKESRQCCAAELGPAERI